MTNTTSTPGDARLHRLLGFLSDDPANGALQSDIFDMALQQGAFGLAQQRIDAALQANGADPLWRHRQALLCIAQGDYAQADRLLDALEAEGHPAATLRYNRAYIAFREARYADACGVLEPLLNAADAPPDTLALHLRCLHRQVLLAEALAVFERQVALERADAAAFGVASLIAVDADRLADASAWADLALRALPFQLEALVARGTAAVGQRDVGGAIDWLQRAREVHPQDGRTWSALGLAFMMDMKLAPALEHFQRAVEYMPGHIGTWHGMAWCQLLLKDVAGAQQSFERAFELDRNFGETHGGLAVTYAMLGQVALAQASIERALRLDPVNLSARYAQAIINGETADAERFARMAERVLGARTDSAGTSLAEIVLRRAS